MLDAILEYQEMFEDGVRMQASGEVSGYMVSRWSRVKAGCAFATALVLPWAVSRRLRPVALSGSMPIAACQIPSALLYVEPPPPIAIVGLPSCEMRSQMRSHNGPPRGIHSYLCEMKTVEIKPFLRFPNS